MSKVNLRGKDLATLKGIFRRFQAIREVRLFGSRATSDARRVSDIDLAFVAPEMTTSEWTELVLELDEAPIIYEIDAVRADRLAEGPFKERIRREGVPIYMSVERETGE